MSPLNGFAVSIFLCSDNAVAKEYNTITTAESMDGLSYAVVDCCIVVPGGTNFLIQWSRCGSPSDMEYLALVELNGKAARCLWLPKDVASGSIQNESTAREEDTTLHAGERPFVLCGRDTSTSSCHKDRSITVTILAFDQERRGAVFARAPLEGDEACGMLGAGSATIEDFQEIWEAGQHRAEWRWTFRYGSQVLPAVSGQELEQPVVNDTSINSSSVDPSLDLSVAVHDWIVISNDEGLHEDRNGAATKDICRKVYKHVKLLRRGAWRRARYLLPDHKSDKVRVMTLMSDNPCFRRAEPEPEEIEMEDIALIRMRKELSEKYQLGMATVRSSPVRSRTGPEILAIVGPGPVL